MFYYILVFILLLLSLFNNKYAFTWSFGLILLAAIIRDVSVGTDTIMYVNIYQKSEEYFRDIEPGYAFYMFILNFFNLNAQGFIAITALIIFIPVYIFINKNSYHKTYSVLLFVLLFYYYFSLSGIRQSIASSISMLSIIYLFEGKKKVYVILIILASTFHTSALLMLPFTYLAYTYNLPKKTAYIILILAFIIGWFDLINIRNSIGLLANISLDNTFDLSKYNTYSEYFFDSPTNVSAKIYNMVPISLTAIIVIYLSNKTLDFYATIFLIGTIIVNIFVEIPIAFRVAYYFTIFQIVIVPNLIFKYKYKIPLLFYYTVSILFIFVYETNRKEDYKRKNNFRNDVVPYTVFKTI